jgi:NAD+ diphosphatase
MNTPFYCPRCGDAALMHFDEKIFGCTRCGYTYYHNTAVGVSVIVHCGGRIAWITRANEPGAGLLDLPGGFVEGGESLEAAVLREAREEIGVDLGPPRYLFSLPNRYRHHNIDYRSVDVFFTCTIDCPPDFTPNEEAAALHWLTLEEVPDERIAFTSVREALVRLRADAI